MAVQPRRDLASRHGSIVRIAAAHSWSYRSDNPICTRTPLDPVPDCRVVHLQAAFAEQLFDIAERKRVPQVPAHGAKNKFGLGLSPLEDRRSDCLFHDRFRLPAAVRQSCNTTAMIAHLRGREEALEPFGWSQEDTEWVAMVCLNSGMFTRTQYADYFNVHHSQAARFVQSLVDLGLAVDEPIPVISTRNRTRVCRITHKSIYRELGVPNIQHRRNAGLSVYLRRLLSLDYVIDHSDLEWLPTEDEKVRFCTHYGVPHNRLPHRIYGGAAGCVARYFHLKLPFAGGPTCTFVYVDPGNDTVTEMRYWGQTHEHLWAGLRHRGIKIHVAAIGVTPDAGKRARTVLDGWARDRDGIRAGDYREAELREELDALSRGIDTFDSQIFARYGGQPNAVRRWQELKDMLAKPLPYNIRIDTFEIWRSRRIYPEGVDLYEIPE